MVMKKGIEKIGVTEFLTVKTHARQLYLPLRADITSVFEIHKGDTLKVKIEGRVIQGDDDENENDKPNAVRK